MAVCIGPLFRATGSVQRMRGPWRRVGGRRIRFQSATGLLGLDDGDAAACTDIAETIRDVVEQPRARFDMNSGGTSCRT